MSFCCESLEDKNIERNANSGVACVFSKGSKDSIQVIPVIFELKIFGNEACDFIEIIGTTHLWLKKKTVI